MKNDKNQLSGALEAAVMLEWVMDLTRAIRKHLPGSADGHRVAWQDFPADAQPGSRTIAWLLNVSSTGSHLDQFLWGLVAEMPSTRHTSRHVPLPVIGSRTLRGW
jgi:hypothetical protein